MKKFIVLAVVALAAVAVVAHYNYDNRFEEIT